MPSDPNGDTFRLHVPDLRKRMYGEPRHHFGDLEFVLRFFPPTRLPATYNCEFEMLNFGGRTHVPLNFEWVVENSKKKTKFHRQREQQSEVFQTIV